MNDCTGAMRERRRAWLVKRAVGVICAATLALLATACSGSPSSASSGGSSGAAGSAATPSALAYSACMRSHGVPDYPDPSSNGQQPKTDAQVLGISSSRYDAAQQACRSVLPAGGSLPQQEHQCMAASDCSPALVQQMMTADLKLARCMRSHGIPDFPDPTNDGSSGPVFNISKVGISDAASHSPQFIAKLNVCGRLVGADAPQSFE